MLIVTWANGLASSLSERPSGWRGDGIGCRIVDVRWLAPLPIDEIVRHAEPSGASSSSTRRGTAAVVGEAIVAGLVEAGFAGPARRLAGADSFIPLGDAARLVLVSEDDIESAVRTLCVTE